MLRHKAQAKANCCNRATAVLAAPSAASMQAHLKRNQAVIIPSYAIDEADRATRVLVAFQANCCLLLRSQEQDCCLPPIAAVNQVQDGT